MTNINEVQAMKVSWTKQVPAEPGREAFEIWREKREGKESAYEIHATYGKEIDTASLKRDIVSDFKSAVSKIRIRDETIFQDGNLEVVSVCPVCGTDAVKATKEVEIYKAIYWRCPHCTHCFVNPRPTQKYLEDFYREDKGYQATYADPKTMRLRVDTIAVPKVQWVIQQYTRVYGHEPKSSLDVGAGSGHMVQASREVGLNGTGIELSLEGIKFAKLNFGVELKRINFTQEYAGLEPYDVVMFWGVIEHVPDPMLMLECATKILSDEGMIIIEVPRWQSLATEMQKLFRDTIVRHLVPSSHIHFFSDSSAMTALTLNSLRPVASWYYGMDIYETALQWATKLNLNMSSFKPIESALQPVVDQNRLSDFIAIAGVPTGGC